MTHTQITALWQGISGSPGYTRINFTGSLDSSSAATAAQNMATLFDAIKAYLPSTAAVSWDGIAQVFDGQGQLTGEVAYTPPSTVSGTSGGAYSAASGAVINWLTDVFRSGRRFRGRSYLVPLTSAAYENDGSLSPAALTVIRDAAATFASSSPNAAIFGGSAARGWATATVTGSSVPDRVAVLRSRRD